MSTLAEAHASQPADVAFDELIQRARVNMVARPRQALADAVKAVARADRQSEPTNRALAHHIRGEVHRLLGQQEAALEDYAEAARLYRRVGQPADAARSDASAVDSLRSLGRVSDALQLAERARRVLRRHGEQLRSAILDEIVGLVYFQQDDYERAHRQFERARPIIAAFGRPLDLAMLNNNAATALTNLDRLREAEALYAAARKYYAEQGSDAALARVDVNLGYLAFRQGRYGAAVDLLRRAADVQDSVRNLPFAVRTRLDLIETYLALNLLDEAGSLAEAQLRLATDLALDVERARALFYLSMQRGRVGRVDDALAGLREAEAVFASEANLVWRTRCALGQAALLVARGEPADLPTALRLARRAARVFGRLGLPSRHASACVMLARAYLQRGRAHAAEDQARAALWLAQGVGVPWLLFESHYILGRALRARGEHERAYVEYREATEALERVRAELQPEELRLSLVSDKTDVYQELVLLCLERGSPDEALRQAERAKSRAFAERLAGSVEVHVDPQVIGVNDAQVIERMRQLRDELVWLYSRLSEAAAVPDAPHAPTPTPAQVHRLRRDVAAGESELVRLQRRLQPASREHAAALGIASGAVTVDARLAALRRSLPDGTAVLEFFAAGEELVLFVFDRRRLAAYRLGPIARVAELVDRFRFHASKFGLGTAYVRAHAAQLLDSINRVLAELYTILIDPVADELVAVQRLAIVPHGILHYLPFHALMDPSGTPLIERIEISYAPSAGVLATCRERPGLMEGLGRPLLVSVPDPSTPHVRGEIDALERVFHQPIVLAGEAATEQAFRRHAPEADVIHLASHAVFRQDNPLFSAIRLADGWLSLYDLYGMRLRASLVTLSACETGVNDVLAGDELVGLTRGLVQAGAASVVVSLWAVNDASTAQLMKLFYAHLERGLGPAAALRAAQSELRRTYPHPYYWAPFLVVGRS